MKKVLWTVIYAGVLLGVITLASAQRGEWRGGIRARIHFEKDRIERGIKQGILTRKEARRLHRELDGILDKIDLLRDDGHLSRNEREIIEHDLDRLHRHISREKRDDDIRPRIR